MARIAPGNTPKFAYILLVIIASLFLYLDIQYKTFTPTKNLFNSGLLTSNLLVKSIIFNPIGNIYNVTRSKIDLVNTNTSLSNELELSRIENFLILNKDELENWKKRIIEKGYVAIDTETDSLNAIEANLIGFSLAIDVNDACYIPLRHDNANKQINFDDAIAVSYTHLTLPTILLV